MALTIKQKYMIKRFIRNLERIRGRHTELISVYVPAGYDIIKIINHLEQEKGTAANIKDKTTRTHVINSLEKMIQHLKLYKKTPENGLAVFAGDVSEKEGKPNFKVFSIEPPEPLNVRMYRCDQTFKLDLLKDMLEHKEIFGLIIIERKEATIGLLQGATITELITMTSGVPGKTKAGGQSAARFARLREEATKEFFTRIGEYLNQQFLPLKELKGILVGGPGPTKEDFLNGHWMNTQLKQKIVCVQDTCYTGLNGLNELVDKSKQQLAKEIIIEERESMQKFFKLLGTAPEKVVYGVNEVKKALELDAVEKLLISETLEEEITDMLSERCEKSGGSVQIISVDTPEGMQLRDIGKVAAILRYPIY